jgi:hypothetical protein
MVTKYEVFMQHNIDQSPQSLDHAVLAFEGDTLTTRIAHLIPNTKYFVAIVACNVAGVSSPSEWTAFTTVQLSIPYTPLVDPIVKVSR